MDLYREQLLELYHHPQHWGLKDGDFLQQRGYNPICGDDITVQLLVEGSAVKSMQFEGNSCVISRAAASLLSEKIVDAPVDEIIQWQVSDIEALLGISIPAARMQCALLALKTVHLILKK